MFILKILLFVASFVVVLYVIDFLHRKFGLFEYRKNPYRRYCRKCGQLQNQFCRPWNLNEAWWEDMGDIFDPDCECHKHSKYVQ